MMEQHKFVITIILFLTTTQAKMMRNSALITKMVSNFHQNKDASEPNQESESVLIRMQIVLCKNFPTIPCELITQDKTLKKLIEKSIQQINNKKLSLDNKTTPFPGYLTVFPTLNNDDLSKFIQMNDVIDNPGKKKRNQKKKISKQSNQKVKARAMRKKNHQGHKKIITNKSKRTSVYKRKKLRKFYPHLVKTTQNNNHIGNIGENTAEKLSISVEVPSGNQHQRFSYKVEPENPPVWRIDYTKHGDPSIHGFDYGGDRFNRKMTKTGTDLVDYDNEQFRKTFIHPDVFIKNNFVKTNSENSDGLD